MKETTDASTTSTILRKVDSFLNLSIVSVENSVVEVLSTLKRRESLLSGGEVGSLASIAVNMMVSGVNVTVTKSSDCCGNYGFKIESEAKRNQSRVPKKERRFRDNAKKSCELFSQDFIAQQCSEKPIEGAWIEPPSVFEVGCLVQLRKDKSMEGVIMEEKSGGWRVVRFTDGSQARCRPSELKRIVVNAASDSIWPSKKMISTHKNSTKPPDSSHGAQSFSSMKVAAPHCVQKQSQVSVHSINTEMTMTTPAIIISKPETSVDRDQAFPPAKRMKILPHTRLTGSSNYGKKIVPRPHLRPASLVHNQADSLANKQPQTYGNGQLQSHSMQASTVKMTQSQSHTQPHSNAQLQSHSMTVPATSMTQSQSHSMTVPAASMTQSQSHPMAVPAASMTYQAGFVSNLSPPTLMVGSHISVRKTGQLGVVVGEKPGGWRIVQFQDGSGHSMFRPSDVVLANRALGFHSHAFGIPFRPRFTSAVSTPAATPATAHNPTAVAPGTTAATAAPDTTTATAAPGSTSMSTSFSIPSSSSSSSVVAAHGAVIAAHQLHSQSSSAPHLPPTATAAQVAHSLSHMETSTRHGFDSVVRLNQLSPTVQQAPTSPTLVIGGSASTRKTYSCIPGTDTVAVVSPL